MTPSERKLAAQERARCQNDRVGPQLAPIGQPEADHARGAVRLQAKRRGLALDDRKRLLRREQLVNRSLVAPPVGLDSLAPAGRALAGIEQAIMDGGMIRRARDQDVEGIHLPTPLAPKSTRLK